MLTVERKEKYWNLMQEQGGEPLLDKDLEAITMMMTSQPGLKAFGRIFAAANTLPRAIMTLDLSTEVGRRDAVQLQGRVAGYIHAIEIIFDLITLPEEDEDEQPYSPE